MTETTTLNKFIDNHLFCSNRKGYLWCVTNEAIVGVATPTNFPFVMNPTYIKNAIRDNDKNFCALEVYTTKRGGGDLTTDDTGMQALDDITALDNFVNKHSDELQIKHFELQPKEEGGEIPKVKDFVEMLHATAEEMAK